MINLSSECNGTTLVSQVTACCIIGDTLDMCSTSSDSSSSQCSSLTHVWVGHALLWHDRNTGPVYHVSGNASAVQPRDATSAGLRLPGMNCHCSGDVFSLMKDTRFPSNIKSLGLASNVWQDDFTVRPKRWLQKFKFELTSDYNVQLHSDNGGTQF